MANSDAVAQRAAKPSSLVDTRVIYCGDNLEQLKKLPDACVDLIYIDPPFNSNRNYEVFWGETKEKRSFEDRHESTQAYIEFMRPRCVELARVLKKTGSFYYHCDWHASHYVKVMLDQIFGENNFINEIIWKRSQPTVTPNRAASTWQQCQTRIFLYAGGRRLHVPTRNIMPYDESYVERTSTGTSKRATGGDTAKRHAAPRRSRAANVHLTIPEVYGPHPADWAVTAKDTWRSFEPRAAELSDKSGRDARYKRYLDESPGIPLQTSGTTSTRSTPRRRTPRLSHPEAAYPSRTHPQSLLQPQRHRPRRLLRLRHRPRRRRRTSNANGSASTSPPPPAASWPSASAMSATSAKTKSSGDIGKGFVVRDLPWTRKATARNPAVRVRELGRHRPRRHPQQSPGRRHGHRRPHLPRLAPCPSTAAKPPANSTSWTTGIPSRSSRRTRSAAPTSTCSRPP